MYPTIEFTHYPNTSHTGDASKYQNDIRCMLSTIYEFYPQRDKYISIGSILRRAFMILLHITKATQRDWYFRIYTYKDDSTLNCVLYEDVNWTYPYYSFFHNRNKDNLAGSDLMEHYINYGSYTHYFFTSEGIPSFRWMYKLGENTRYGNIIRSTYIDKDKTDKYFDTSPTLARAYTSIRARMLHRKSGLWMYFKYDPDIMQNVYPDCTYGYSPSIQPIFHTSLCLYSRANSLVSTIDRLLTTCKPIRADDVYNCTKLVI